MDVVVTFLITVIGGVVCRIICRWSDGDGDDNWILKNPGLPPGFSCRRAARGRQFLFPVHIIVYADLSCNIFLIIFFPDRDTARKNDAAVRSLFPAPAHGRWLWIHILLPGPRPAGAGSPRPGWRRWRWTGCSRCRGCWGCQPSGRGTTGPDPPRTGNRWHRGACAPLAQHGAAAGVIDGPGCLKISLSH